MVDLAASAGAAFNVAGLRCGKGCFVTGGHCGVMTIGQEDDNGQDGVNG